MHTSARGALGATAHGTATMTRGTWRLTQAKRFPGPNELMLIRRAEGLRKGELRLGVWGGILRWIFQLAHCDIVTPHSVSVLVLSSRHNAEGIIPTPYLHVHTYATWLHFSFLPLSSMR